MVIVSEAGRVTTVRAAARVRAGAAGFRVDAPAARGAAAPQVCGALALDGMLALQEAGEDIVRDREARRHGQALLKGLAALQHALLANADPGAALDGLAALAGSCPAAAHPGLAGVMQALTLRVQVELARRNR